MLHMDKFHSLKNMLESDNLGNECLDFIELHGYITASLISPLEINISQLIVEILGDGHTANTEITKILTSNIQNLIDEIERQLFASDPLQLPCEIEIGESDETPSDLERWCMAFVEKHLMDEEQWFEIDESAVAELMLPIIAASGIFEEPEIAGIRENEVLFISMLEHIPEVVIDLYGLFHNDQ